MKRRVGIVTPWFGPDAVGGAESLARELATRLAEDDEVTILTTTSRSFLHEWSEDYHRPGVDLSETFGVLRFPVDSRDKQLFDSINGELLSMPPDSRRQLATRRAPTDPFIEQSINSRALEQHLRDAGTGYDAVLFLPYLYGVVVRGIEAYPGPAHLLPCLHDEAYAYLPRIEGAIHRVASLLFNSEGEAELALRLYGPGILHKSVVIGSGIPPAPTERSPIELKSPYVLYLGRRDVTKNVDFLVEAFHDYRRHANGEGSLSLVLAGPGNVSYADEANGIIDFGFVDDAKKVALLRDATALLQPSLNESYSRVLMEAWREEVPVAAHIDCLATATAVRVSEGGWLAGDVREWAGLIAAIEAAKPDDRKAIGRRGAAYASENADWSSVIERVRRRMFPTQPRLQRTVGKRRIDQVLPTLEYGDAVSDYAIHIQDALRMHGIESTIYAEAIGTRVADRARVFADDRGQDDHPDLVLYHHSISCASAQAVAVMATPKVMIYHNVTPARFFAPYRPDFAELLQVGREQTRELTRKFDRYVAVSQFNADELLELGAPEVTVVPLAVDFRRFDVLPDEAVLRRQKRGTRWLFVGRIAPNKGLLPLIEAFEAYLAVDGDATLAIVGTYDPADIYYRSLVDACQQLRVSGSVRFTGSVSNAELCAYYRSSDVYVSLSEHEGFCVPIVEAMYFDLPIVARDSTAVPGTLGEGGVLVSDGMGAVEIAALVELLRADESLRRRVLAAQRNRRAFFSPEAGDERIRRLVEDLAQ